jgi:hypothetical protein
MIVVWLATIVTGCGESPKAAHNDINQSTENSDSDSHKAWMVEDESARQSVLSQNLILPQVAAFADTLASWGYSYREQNSLVIVGDPSEPPFAETTPSGSVPRKVRPDAPIPETPVVLDTVVWQVFENATSDSSIHTAIITGYHGGEAKSIFVEIDVSTDSLNLIRGTVLSDSGATWNDPMVLGLWDGYSKCVTACCVGCAIRCVFMGPGWAACWALCCANCYGACAIAVIIAALT